MPGIVLGLVLEDEKSRVPALRKAHSNVNITSY